MNLINQDMYQCNEMTTRRKEKLGQPKSTWRRSTGQELSLGGIDEQSNGNSQRQKEVEAVYNSPYVSFILM